MTPYTLSISIALITLIPLVASHPSYWVRTYRTAASGKCTEHPKFGYGPHSQRIFDDKGITFELTLDGKQQTEVCPGTVYNLEVRKRCTMQAHAQEGRQVMTAAFPCLEVGTAFASILAVNCLFYSSARMQDYPQCIGWHTVYTELMPLNITRMDRQASRLRGSS